MPTKKTKKQAEPTSPADSGYGSPKADEAKEPPKKRIRTSATKKATPAVAYYALSQKEGEDAAIIVSGLTNSPVSLNNTTAGEYELQLKLHGPRSFAFKHVQQDETTGEVMVVLQPSKPFPLMKLPDDLRNKIFKMVVMPENDPQAKIVINNTASGVKSKNFAEGMKDRLGVLRVNKLINAEIMPMVYGNHIRFDDNKAATNFINRIGDAARALLTFVEISVYKKDSGMALTVISRCPKINRVHIGQGVGIAATPSKAAKAFYAENEYFFQTLARGSGNRNRGMDVLTTGKSNKCFSIKEGDGEKRAYTVEEKAEFEEILKAQIK
ncbi:Hypothetical protein D9617_9g023700 [Elsinoe fawcettii]|nr:Hypothetical protein D9617_9g023700 [Elsinoe fawcettii]